MAWVGQLKLCVVLGGGPNSWPILSYIVLHMFYNGVPKKLKRGQRVPALGLIVSKLHAQNCEHNRLRISTALFLSGLE